MGEWRSVVRREENRLDTPRVVSEWSQDDLSDGVAVWMEEEEAKGRREVVDGGMVWELMENGNWLRV